MINVASSLAPDDRRTVFAILVLAVLAGAAGHLYLIAGLTDLYLGAPLWLWVHLAVLVGLLGVAWIAIEYVYPGGGR